MAKKAIKIVLLYAFFVLFSMAINISAQMLSILIYKGQYFVEVSILIGTAAGLPIRYLLEKRYIFAFQSNNINHDGKLFVLYSFMGVFTTALFWGVEYAFHILFATDSMRYLGGFIGLTIGFYVKYKLDKKYVFVSANEKVEV